MIVGLVLSLALALAQDEAPPPPPEPTTAPAPDAATLRASIDSLTQASREALIAELVADALAERIDALEAQEARLREHRTRVEYYPRDHLSLVKGGVETHPFRLGIADVPALSVAVGFAAAHRDYADDREFLVEVGLSAMQFLPSMVVLETGPGTGLRNTGRAVVILESSLWGQTSASGLAWFLEDIARQPVPRPVANMARYTDVAGTTGSLSGWYATMLKSRRRRGLALDPETLAGIPLVIGAAGGAGCALVGAFDQSTQDRNGQPRTPGDPLGCIAATATAGLVGVLVPAVHVKGRRR